MSELKECKAEAERYRERRRSFGLSEREIDREVAFGKIISSWNKAGRYYVGLVDCGKLGVALIYWHRRWSVQWYELEMPPDGLR